MLSKEEMDLLTHVGPGTPMGELFRRYWVPVLLSEEIPEPDCAPVKVKLLGEDLVVFRDSEGRVGVLEELCSHRRASLFYGRNEEGGLRCVYHGWKYDVAGNVLETPAEPPESQLRCKIKHTAYPSREAAGMVFAYMGPKEKQPLFPTFEWLGLPEGHVEVTKWYQDCNYLQALEGDCDPGHLAYLHRGTMGFGTGHNMLPPIASDVSETRFGIKSHVVRVVPPDKKSVRVSHFVMPFLGCNPVGKMTNGKVDGGLIVYQTPADDYHTWRYHFRFRRSEPLLPEEMEFDRVQVLPDHSLKEKKENSYFVVDREKQRKVNFTGLEGFAAQDTAVIEGMGPVSDRTKEHLGFSDLYVIALRKFLLHAVREFQDGKEPPGINIADSSEVKLTTELAPWDKA